MVLSGPPHSQNCGCVRVNTHACTHANKYPTVYMQMFSSHCLQQKKLYLSRRMQLPLALDLLIYQNSLALLHWCRESQMLAIPLYSCFPSSEMHHTESSYQQIWSYLYFQTLAILIILSFPWLSLCKWSSNFRWWNRFAQWFFTLKSESRPRKVSLEHAQVKLSYPKKYYETFSDLYFVIKKRPFLLITCRRN